MNIISSIRYFYLRKIYPGFLVKDSDVVIDIGSGDKPFWRADVYVDRLSLGNVQRASTFNTIHDVGLFVDADVTKKMPFRQKSFDFSFCSHLLEHVDDPASAIKEIVRISKRGYIEVPNGILETIKPFDSHLWFIFLDQNTLVFIRKSKTMHELLAKNGIRFQPTLDIISDPFIRLYWEHTVKYKIIDELKVSEKFRSKIGDNKSSKKNINYYLLMVKFIRAIFHDEKNNSDLKTKVTPT